jgi:hypothetical protein
MMVLSAFRAPMLAGVLAVLWAVSANSDSRAEGWGTLRGQVVWNAAVPARAVLDTSKEPACVAANKGPLFSEETIVNSKNKGVKNVVVFLIDASGDFNKPVPIHPTLKDAKLPDVEMDQPCCQFVPHVLAIRAGQNVVIKNSASISHNIHVIGGPQGPEFNVILPPTGQKKEAGIKPRSRPITVKCDIHPWMSGWIWVLPHPYFAVTDEDGKFTIKNAPAGEWKMVTWHESKGWVQGTKTGIPVTIKADGPTDLDPILLTPSKD